MNETYYTIKQIADIAGVSKVTMFRYIKSNSIQETKHKGNANLYNETTKNAILKGFEHKNSYNDSETKRNDKTTEIQLLKEQLAKKDTQIKELHEIVTQTQKLVDQSQQLQLQTQKELATANEKVKELENPLKNDSNEVKTDSDINISEQNKKPADGQPAGQWWKFWK